MNDTIKTLRDRKTVKLWDKENKWFVYFQVNIKEHFICFVRYHSRDRSNWVEQNSYLTLKDTVQCIEQLKQNNIKHHGNN